jgi:hypothetical protein
VRRDGDRVVLVVANLGPAAARGVTLGASAGTLPAGRWTVHDALGGAAGAPLAVAADGALAGYSPLGTLAPLTGYVFELLPAGRAR